MGKLAATQSTDKLFELIEKSSLLAPKPLEQAKQICADNPDPKMAARRLIKEGLLTTWQAKQLLGGYAGLKFGKYKLLDELGAGSLGRVYLAEHSQLGRRVAIKALARRHTQQPDSINRFLAQARDISALDHRNIIHVFDVDSEGDRYYLVMEFAEGRDLQKLVTDEGALPFATVADIVRQIVNGLAHAHSRGLTHLDLKPANVFVDKNGGVKILDLGVSRLNEAVDSGGDAAAEPAADDAAQAFRAPEQLRRTGRYDHRTDIYSLGRLMSFVLAGKLPPAENGQPNAECDQLRKLRPDAPQELLDLCAKMTAEKPEDRWPTADAVGKAIDEWVAAQSEVVATPPSPESAPAPAAAAPPPKKLSAERQETAAIKSQDTTDQESASQEFNWTPKSKSSNKTSKTPKSLQQETKSPITVPPIMTAADKPVVAAKRPAKELPLKKQTAPAIEANNDRDVNDAQPMEVLPVDLDDEPSTPAPQASSDSVPFGDFAIQTNPSRLVKKSSNKGARKSAPTAAAATESKPTTKPGKTHKSASAQQKKMRLIIGASVGGTVAVLVAIVVTVIMILKNPSGKPVAKGPAKGEATASADAQAKEKPADEQPADKSNDKPEAGNPASEKTAPDASAAKPAPEKQPGPGATAAPTATVPAPDAGGEKPVPPAPVKPPDKPPETPAAPATNPAPPPPDKPPPPPPPPAVEVFKDLALAVALPPLDAKSNPNAIEPVKLGVIHVTPKATCIMRLEGGDRAKGKTTFVMEESDGGTAPRDWDITAREGASTTSTPIAHLKLAGEDLLFNWTPEAQTQASAPFLANCILNINATGAAKPRDLGLRQTIEVAPIAIDVLKGEMKAKCEIPFAPDKDRMRIEISLEGRALPKHKFDKSKEMEVDKGSTSVLFTPNDIDHILALKVDSTLTGKRTVGLTASSFFKLATDYERTPAKFSAANLKKREKQAPLDLQRVIALLEAAKAAAAAAKGPQKEAIDTSVAQGMEKVKDFEKAVEQCKQVSSMAEALNAGGKLHFRVYHQADDGKQVDLVRTNNSAAAPGPAK